MVEISLSASGEGPGWATAPGYSTTRRRLWVKGRPVTPSDAGVVAAAVHSLPGGAWSRSDDASAASCGAGTFHSTDDRPPTIRPPGRQWTAVDHRCRLASRMSQRPIRARWVVKVGP